MRFPEFAEFTEFPLHLGKPPRCVIVYGIIFSIYIREINWTWQVDTDCYYQQVRILL